MEPSLREAAAAARRAKAEATKQSIAQQRRKLDCFVASAPLRKRFAFVAGNDDDGHESAIPRLDPPEVCLNFRATRIRGRGECRMRAAPAVPCAKWVKENAHEHTGSAENIRHSLRNGFTAYTRSPRRRIRLVTVVGELTASPRPVGPACLRQLDTSNGCQNHTTSPYAAASFVSALLIAHGSWLNPEPALPSRFTPNAAASTASRPASLTIRIRPSVGQDGEGYIGESGEASTAISENPNLSRICHSSL